MNKRFGSTLVGAILVAGCGSSPQPGSETSGSESSAISISRFPGGITPRSITPVFTPLAISSKPVKVMVELDGDPMTLVAAQVPDRKLTAPEKQQIRESIRGRQSAARAHIESLGGRVLGEYQNSYNGLKVHIGRDQLAALAQVPGVVAVHPVRLMHRGTTRATPFVGAPAAWNGVAGVHGENVKVAIIDTGIDYTHSNFGGPGTVDAYNAAHAAEASPADPALFGPAAARVKGGTDLVGDAYDPASTDPAIATPKPDPNPLDCNGHGSHVAGIAAGSGVTPDGHTFAGPYNANTFTNTFGIGPGVAPKADLYAVRVFGCEGATDVTLDAIEWAVDNDMDVINMSLGSDFGAPDDPSAIAARNAVRSGVVVAAAAGNAGNNFYIESTPASGDGVLSVAATDATPSFPGAALNLGSSTIQALNSNGATFADGTSYRVVVLGTPGAVGLGCTAAEYARPDVPGALVVTVRGVCPRTDRATLGQAAGAVAVAMINTDPGFPPFEGPIAGVTIPFFGVKSTDAAALAAATTLTATNATLQNPGFRLPASFSSGGPRWGDSEIKPNVIAPGVSVVSTANGTGNGAVTLSGTSMATPVVAGVAALARQAHPSWRARDVAAAIVNTSDPAGVTTYSTRLSGAGVPQAQNAVKTEALVSSDRAPGISFGFVEQRDDLRLKEEVRVQNRSSQPMTFDVSVASKFVQGLPHTARVSRDRVRVAPHDSTTFHLEVAVPAPASVDPIAFNEIAGVVQLVPSDARSNHGVTLRVPYYGVIRPVARVNGELEPAPTPKLPNGKAEVENFRTSFAGSADLYAWGIQGKKDSTVKSCNDVRAAGVQSSDFNGDRLLVFAINTFERCSSAAINEYDVLIANEDGEQFAVVGIDEGLLTAGEADGNLITAVINVATGATTQMPALAPTDSATVQLVALASQLNLSSAKPRFAYLTQTFNFAGQGDDAQSDPATFNAFSSSVLGQGQFTAVNRNQSIKLPIGVDATEFAITPAKGLMVLELENSPGTSQADLLSFRAFGQ